MTSPKAVLMLVGNDIRNDTRVLKSAQALSEGGLDVTVLGYASAGVREESKLGRVRLLLVPVPWALRDGAKQRRHGISNLIELIQTHIFKKSFSLQKLCRQRRPLTPKSKTVGKSLQPSRFFQPKSSDGCHADIGADDQAAISAQDQRCAVAEGGRDGRP